MNAYDNRSADTLESEAEATRQRMNETIEALEYKLSPGQLLDESIDYLRHSGSGEFMSNLTRSARTNPMPVVLAGISLGWLMLTNPARQPYDGARLGQAKDRTKGKAKAAAGKAQEAAHSTRERMHDARERMHDARERMYEAGEGTRALGGKAADNARRAADQFSRILHEQPLVVGALGLALGAALGAGLPSTETEDEVMGEARDQAVDKAAEAGREQAEKVQATAQAAAQSAAETAKQEAQREGLTQQPQH
ncbi:MAG TPA: DUF3618 domain-containing protein [Gammaproteobacteria bacterium]|nr:DUF3618 domain-containing protein [Gammaproteobacteria bacterium]